MPASTLRRCTTAIAVACLLATTLARAQQPADEKIEPSREDFATGTDIVPIGSIQVESGVGWSRGDRERHWSFGEVQLRIPVSRSVEVHLGIPSYLVDHADGRASGFDDASLEARWRFHEGEVVELALQGVVMLPTGSKRVAERHPQPGALLAAEIALSPAVQLVLNVGGQRASSDGQRFDQGFVAAALEFDLSRRWSLFAETYAFNREEKDGSSRRYAAVGAVWFVGRSTAFDVRVGRGLGNDDGIDTFAGLGVSHRF